MAEQYQQFASDFTGSIAQLQQNTCEDFAQDNIPVDIPCPTCTPDPNAIVPDWTTLDDKQPFLNKKTCQYSIVIVTQYTDVGDNYASRAKEYAPVAARRLLRYYNKLETDLIVDTLVNGYEDSGPVIEAADWFLPLEPNSNLKILYTINAFNFDGLAPDSEDPLAFNQQVVPSSNQIVLDLNTLGIKLDRLTKTLGVYGKFQAALRNVDNGSIVVEGTNKEFIIGSITNETSLVYEFSIIESALNNILVDNNFDTFGTFIPSFVSWFSDVRKADKMILGITDEFVIDKITIQETGCPDYIVNEKKLDKYIDESPLNNPTIIAYLSRIDEMYDESIAIEAPDWTEFLLEYTYPNITVNYGQNKLFDDEESLAECIANAVAEYGNTVSNRLLDSVYSFPDMVADKLNKFACKEDTERDKLTAAQLIAEQNGEFFKKLDESVKNSDAFKAFNVIKDFKSRISGIKKAGGKATLIKIYDSILNDYGFCGLLSLFQSLFQCISTGFSFEEILTKMLQASFKNFTPLQMAKFLELLPSDKKVEVINKVNSVLEQNDIASSFFNTFNYVNNQISSGSYSQEFQEQKEYEDELQNNINASKSTLNETYQRANQRTSSSRQRTNSNDNSRQRTSSSDGTTGSGPDVDTTSDTTSTTSDSSSTTSDTSGVVVESATVLPNEPVSIIETFNEIQQAAGFEEDTLQQQIVDAQQILKQKQQDLANYRNQLGKNSVGKTLGQIQQIIMQAYVDAFFEFVSADELYAILLKFPGVKLLTQLVNSYNCPTPDDNAKVTWLNFLNTLEIEWCKLHFDITLPPLPTIPDIGAFFSTLWKALSQVVKELIIKLISEIIQEVILKLLEILLTSLCSLLDTLVNVAEAAVTGQNPANVILDMLRETFGCPPLDNAEQEQALLEAVAQIFGGQGASGVTTEEVASYLQTVSTSLTPFELVDLLKGNLSSDKAKYLKSVLRAKEPRLAQLFPNESSIASLFSTIGNLVPDEILNNFEIKAADFIDAQIPANLSVCATPESIERFTELRESILSGKGLTDDQIRHQIDGMQQRAEENLTLLTELAATGLGNYAGDRLISAMYGSASLTSPYSALESDSCGTSLYSNPLNNSSVQAVQNSANDLFFTSIKTSYLNDLFKEPTIFDKGSAFSKQPVAFLNAILSDKNGRDYVKHIKRTDDVIATLYNSQEQEEDVPLSIPFKPQKTSDNYFPTTVANLTRQSLIDATGDFDGLAPKAFFTRTTSYNARTDAETPKRILFGKKEDYSFTINTSRYPDFVPIGKKYHLLFSQFALKDGDISSDNLNRLAVLTESELTEVKELKIPSDIQFDQIEALTSTLLIGKVPKIETYNVIYQSRYDLDDNIRQLKEQYLPSYIENSPQADCFISFVNSKISIGQYSTPQQITIDNYDSIADRGFKFINQSLSEPEAYLFGYDYQNDKITQEDIELDPDTLERKTNNPRVVFLDYTKYGGTEDQPPIYIKPPARTGWLGVADSIIPEFGCEPKVENIVNFDELSQLMTELQRKLSDDIQLAYSPECRELVPYIKPLSSIMAANLQVAVVTTLRIYISEAILRCMPLYNKFVVSYDKVIDELYIDYILTKIEKGLLNQPRGILNTVNDEYYLQFLEQCVQVVSRKLIAEEITLTDVEQQAMDSINAMIRDFYFVKNKDFKFLEQMNEILKDLKQSTIILIDSIRNSEFSKIEENYSTFEPILNTRASEYDALKIFSEGSDTVQSIPQLYETFVANYPSNSASNNLINQLKTILTTISNIQNNVGTSMKQMLITVMNKLNEQSITNPSLKRIRKEMVLQAIRDTKVEAKILLRKILKDEISAMSSNFAAHIYTTPTKTNIRKYFLDSDNFNILRNGSNSYFDVASSSDKNPLDSLKDVILSDSAFIDYLNAYEFQENPNGFFFLERYVKLQDRTVPISGTVIPEEIINRPENLFGVVNANSFKEWIGTLPTEVQNTEMFKLFGDLSVTGSQEQGYQLTGSTLGIKYGLRLSYVPPKNVFSDLPSINTNINMLEKAYFLPVCDLNSDGIKNSQYIIPIVQAEIDMINDTLASFDPNSGTNQYNHDCLVKELYESEEFRFLFYYCVPLQKYMSAVCAFITETYVKTIGIADEWVAAQQVTFDEKFLNFYKSKEACQIFFDIFYNWEDTEYKNPILSNLTKGPDALMERVNTLLRPVGPFVITKDRILERRPYDDNGNECEQGETE